MRNVDVLGLDGFIINNVDFVLFPLHFHFDFTFPVMTLVGTHRTIAQIAGVIPVPISGEGPFSMRINRKSFSKLCKISKEFAKNIFICIFKM